jgi:hypothetical protein
VVVVVVVAVVAGCPRLNSRDTEENRPDIVFWKRPAVVNLAACRFGQVTDEEIHNGEWRSTDGRRQMCWKKKERRPLNKEK